MNVLLVAQNYNKVLVYLKVLIRVKFNYLRSHLDRVKMERIEKKKWNENGAWINIFLHLVEEEIKWSTPDTKYGNVSIISPP